MFFETLLQFGGLGGACHLRQGAQYLPFGKVDVLEGVIEEIFQRLFLGHFLDPCSGENRECGDTLRSEDRANCSRSISGGLEIGAGR
ncbi:hypothetical protein ACOJBO_20250 [Rhizobium beringeri]